MQYVQAPPDRVAIDGPSASGKSTVGKMLAERLGYRFLDTGAMYRCVTYFALARQLDISDHAAITELAESLDFQLRTVAGGDSLLTVCGATMSDQLTSDDVNASVSAVSAVPGVRDAMVAQQSGIAADGAIVMAGRDIGTVVMPDAPLKVYLDASAEARARRRTNDVASVATADSYRDVLLSIEHRDERDSTRSHSPLARAEDAVYINTDDLSLSQVVDRIAAACNQRIGSATP